MTEACIEAGSCHTIFASREGTRAIIGNPIPLNSTTVTNNSHPIGNRTSTKGRVYWIAIFFGASSGVDRGKVTVKTPSTMVALISSGCKHRRQHPIQHRDQKEEHIR